MIPRSIVRGVVVALSLALGAGGALAGVSRIHRRSVQGKLQKYPLLSNVYAGAFRHQTTEDRQPINLGR
jgi:hypothetical protein